MKNLATWSCKIGEVNRGLLPHGSDAPMREAVARAYRELTGVDDVFIFSGWGATLTEAERAVVEDREPDPFVIRDALYEQLAVVEAYISGLPLAEPDVP